jgi:hypothetical protein
VERVRELRDKCRRYVDQARDMLAEGGNEAHWTWRRQMEIYEPDAHALTRVLDRLATAEQREAGE